MIEAVFEEMTVKKQVFADVEAVVSPTCVLATNTSSLSITEMAADLEHPERVVGFHFFNPVAVMPLLEIVARRADRRRHAGHGVRHRQGAEEDHASWSRTARRSSSTGCSAASWARSAGSSTRAPRCTVADGAFAGVAPMPPFFLLSLVGPAIALHNSETLHARVPGPVLRLRRTCERVVAAGKTSVYAAGRRRRPRGRGAAGEAGATGRCSSAPRCAPGCWPALAEEARLMLDEGVVAAPEDLDLAMITGAGFSFWNGGLTMLLDREGIAERVTGQALPLTRAACPGPVDWVA